MQLIPACSPCVLSLFLCKLVANLVACRYRRRLNRWAARCPYRPIGPPHLALSVTVLLASYCWCYGHLTIDSGLCRRKAQQREAFLPCVPLSFRVRYELQLRLGSFKLRPLS